jgi:hypothetical protein
MSTPDEFFPSNIDRLRTWASSEPKDVDAWIDGVASDLTAIRARVAELEEDQARRLVRQVQYQNRIGELGAMLQGAFRQNRFCSGTCALLAVLLSILILVQILAHR